MPVPTRRSFLACTLLACATLACSKSSAPTDDSRPAGKDAAKLVESPAEQTTPLRFSGIPDADKAKLAEMYEAVAAYLTTALGRPVTYVHVPDYTAAVTALAANKIDFAWLGGVTAIQAEQRTQGHVRYVATREADLHFRSYFVANHKLVESGRFQAAPEPLTSMPLADLAAMRSAFAESSFTFGAKNSTSGHIMPRYFLSTPEVGIDIESGFQGKPGYQLQGGHTATLSAVASGIVDTGVLNFKTWDDADPKLREQAPVIYVTPEYVDYVVVAHDRVGDAIVSSLRQAFISLDVTEPTHAAVLAAFSARQFVPADPSQWQGVRTVVSTLHDAGALD